MSREHDIEWSARMDGEPVPGETEGMKRPLPEDRARRLEAERGFESALAIKLSGDAPCPEDLWRRVQDQIRQHEHAPVVPFSRKRPMRSRLTLGAGALAAAMLLVVAGYAFLQTAGPEAAFLHVAEASVAEMAATSAVPPENQQAAESFLADHDIRLTLGPLEAFSDGHHTTRLIGARGLSFRGDTVVELLFDCCGFPVKVVIVQTGGPAASALCLPPGKGCQVQVVQDIGEYQVAVVGKHDAKNLLDRISAVWAGAMALPMSGAV
jgi:hypothetical protein